MIEADRQILDILQKIKNASTGGGAPSGPAGGDLAGTYPNPVVKNAVKIYDDSHVLAADFGVRRLYRSDGTTLAFDWEASQLSASLYGDIYNDAAFTKVIIASDVYSLIANDGTSTSLDWTNPSKIVLFGSNNLFYLADGGLIQDSLPSTSVSVNTRQLIASNGSVVVLDWSDPAGVALGTIKSGNGANLTGVSASTVTGTTTNDNAVAGNVGEYISASRVVGSATALTTATPKTVTSIPLTAGDWDVTAIGALTGASTGTEFDVAIGTTTNSLTGTVLGDTRCQTPTVSLTGADATLMIPAVRVSISSTTTYYLIVQETFTVGSPAAYGRISARRVR